MVPIDSICGNDRPGQFATVRQHCLLDKTMGIEHSGCFRTQLVADRLVEWLGAGIWR